MTADTLYSLSSPVEGTVYRSTFDGESQGFCIVLHTATEPMAMMPTLRKVLRDLNPDLPPFGAHSMEEVVAEGSAPTRHAALLLGSLAALALALASIGLYGVLSYGVARQRNEIGLRMALGSSRTEVLSRVVTQGLKPAILGLTMGLLAAFGLSRLLASLLRGVQPRDVSTFLSVPVALMAVALLACFIPAWRATRVEPVEALRCE